VAGGAADTLVLLVTRTTSSVNVWMSSAMTPLLAVRVSQYAPSVASAGVPWH